MSVSEQRHFASQSAHTAAGNPSAPAGTGDRASAGGLPRSHRAGRSHAFRAARHSYAPPPPQPGNPAFLSGRIADHIVVAFAQSSSDAIVGSYPDGTIASWNNGAERLYGYSADEVLGRHISFLIPPGLAHELERLYISLGEGKRVERLETVRQHKDGRLVDISLTISPVLGDSGEVIGAASIARDISDLKRAERALRRREFEYRALSEQFPNGAVYLFDRDLRFLIAGGEGLTRAGLSPELVEGRTVYEVLYPEALGDLLPLYQGALTGETSVVERTYGERTYRLTATPVTDETGDIFAGMVLAIDVSEQKLAEGRIRQSEERFRLMFERNPLPTWVCDQESYSFLEVNSAAVEHYGYTREEFLAMTLPEVYPPEDRPGVLNHITARREASGAAHPRVYDDVRHQLKDGQIRLMRVVAQDLMFADRQSVIAILVDMTEAKQHEQSLLQLAASQSMLLRQLTYAEEAERRRLAMEIHDGPLQSLGVAAMGLDRAVRRRERGEPVRADQEIALVRSTLREVIDELRGALADLSQEALVTYGLGVALHAHADRLARLTDMSVQVHDTLNVELSKQAEVLLYRLAQEALSNVRKHAGARRVYVHLKSDGRYVILQVADNGKGFMVEQALGQHVDGRALGLRTMRERIEAAGGEMQIYSAPGEGTVLTFQYPLDYHQGVLEVHLRPAPRT